MPEDFATYYQMGAKLEKYLRLSTFPLAIALIKSERDIPPDFKRPSRDLQLQNFICQNFKMCRSYGWTMAVTEQDTNCRAARMVYGWDTIDEEEAEKLLGFNVGLYSRDLATAKKGEAYTYRLNNAYEGLAISPLARTKIVPDIVLIYCLPAQMMRLIQGYLYCEGGAIESTAAGRMGSCHEGVIKTFLTNKPQIVIAGNGDRIWGGAQDAEVLFACPREKLDTLLEGLEATHAAGLRYPIPGYMNYSPGFQEAFEKRALNRAGITLVKND